MKKVIKFSRFFVPAVIISLVLIAAGVVSLCTRHINFGIDFQPGLIEEVRIAPTAMTLSYNGAANVEIQTSAQGISFVISGAGSESRTESFRYIDYPTVGEMVSAMSGIDGTTAVAVADSSVTAEGFFGSSSQSAVLTGEKFRLYYSESNPTVVSVEDIRELFANDSSFNVKQSGDVSLNTYQIRAGDDGSDPEISEKIQQEILNRFVKKYGEENVAIIKTDFVASNFSSSLASKAIILVIGTMLLIWLYATIRFKWDFALAAIIALLHDSLIIISFISWTQMEFTSTTIAAILTIIGYSINATVVIFDRVRENIRTVKTQNFLDILNISLSDTLSRSLITTVTTMLAVISLFLFTTGTMRDFALALFVGLLSGLYSSIFISGAFTSLTRKNWKPSDEEKKTQTQSVASTNLFAE
ncbi:MAG: protein translocase subunit SecF [Treponemataceae bacterium]|nr:protein translocase subunit SecF [Treponemataceae bacterium]